MASTTPQDSKLLNHSYEAPVVTTADMDTTSQKGWDGFTKFLLSNVVVTIVVLLFIGLLTVWR